MAADELVVDVQPFGPDPADLQQLSEGLLERPALKDVLARTRHQLLSLELLETDRKVARPRAPDRFRATIYDYTNDRTVFADGSVRDPRKLQVRESGLQPLPTREEFDRAAAVIGRDKELGPALREGRLRTYPPMPPLVADDEAGGGHRRVVAVGLLPADGKRGHEIAGVDIARRSVVRLPGGAPSTALATEQACGRPDARQATSGRGYVPGQAWVTVSKGGTVLWRFLAVRPAASSGTNGSGVELRYVDYKGKRVLHRAHVPLLNVRYDNDACGPYLDWQKEEGMIQAQGVDVAPGFRLCPSPAQTALDTGDDAGSFLGVAIYVQGQEVVLVSEMEAGWYRYVSEWRLHANGNIQPRFGFGAVSHTCVCNVHHHHAYWRLDFDIRTAGDNIVREFNDPPLLGKSKWHTIRFENHRPRNPARKRRWRVQHRDTGEAYEIIPGSEDGVATHRPTGPSRRATYGSCATAARRSTTASLPRGLRTRPT
ncbi:MAG: hypothetical protein M3131_06400 [Actinomycetota bacterium]|nr:hypothetical protein [Actinomycetota bacterium]